MLGKKRVIIVGWNPEVLDYSDWPGLTAEKVASALESEKNNLNELGYEANLLFIDDAESAFGVVKNALKREDYDCVLIGAGVRTTPKHFIVFERLINAVHESATKAKICFNTHPGDTAEAVQRWA